MMKWLNQKLQNAARRIQDYITDSPVIEILILTALAFVLISIVIPVAVKSNRDSRKETPYMIQYSLGSRTRTLYAKSVKYEDGGCITALMPKGEAPVRICGSYTVQEIK